MHQVMPHMDETTLRNLAEGDPAAIAGVAGSLQRQALCQADIVRVWEAALEGIQNGRNSVELSRFAMKMLTEATQDPETGKMYENVLALQMYPKVAQAYVPAIGIGASLVRINEGNVPAKLGPNYVQLAKNCLFNAMNKGTEDVRKFAAEALRHIPDADVRQALAAVARDGEVPAVKEAAGESVAFIRTGREIDRARKVKQSLLTDGYPDPTSPQQMYVECVFSAVERVLGRRPATAVEKTEFEIAVRQLASSGAEPGEMAAFFDEKSLQVMRTNVENALIYALTNGPSPRSKEDAAGGLEKIGGDRVEAILDRIVERHGESDHTGRAASDALAGIRGRALEIYEVSVPAPKNRPPPPPRAPIRKLIQ